MPNDPARVAAEAITRDLFGASSGKPGRIGDCYACARDVETPVAGDSDPEGEWALISRRERRQFVSARWLMSGAA